MEGREKMRSFIAAEIPPDIRDGLGEIQRDLRTSGADVKWVRPASIHLTLKFLGEIQTERVGEIMGTLKEILRGHHPFTLEVRGMGCFPRFNQPRVIWVGLAGDEDRLMKIQQAVEDGMVGLGFPLEIRPFRAHLTLGRVRSAKGRIQLVTGIQRLKELELGSFTVGSIIQFRSELHPQGAKYTVLGEVQLGSAAGSS
jgi:2'-5' RNA ligase